MASSGKPPKHQRIADELRERIRSGELLPGTSLPSQRQLSAEFSVTLMTLRQALHSLEKEGLIVLRPGRGTFVGPIPIARQGHGLRSLADELDTQGVKLSTAVVAQGLRALPASIAAHLNQAAGSSARRTRSSVMDEVVSDYRLTGDLQPPPFPLSCGSNGCDRCAVSP